jgi:hypothetical protein
MQFSARLLKRSEPNHEGSRIECRRLVPSVADVAMKKCLHVPSMRHVLRADSDWFHESRNPNNGHEAAVCSNKSKTLALRWHLLTCVAKDIPKRHQASTVFTMLQALS